MTRTASEYEAVREELRRTPRNWVVTGAAGFIGSHLVERLLLLDQHVVGIDNFATGHRSNLAEVLRGVSPEHARRFRLEEGDIRDAEACARALEGAELVLHEAALGSVPRSIENPLQTHDVNVTGFLRVLSAALAAGVRRVVYASSSSVYGDHPALPKVEGAEGRQLSPYAVSKFANELYANAYRRCYGMELIGLRYFNVFGPRQDPEGAYAAVVPRWFAAVLGGSQVVIHGDGETSRDFCFVENVIQANILAATTHSEEAIGQVFNVACGERTTLNELFHLIRERAATVRSDAIDARPEHRELRPGDVRHSLADIGRARTLLRYEPTHRIRDGLDKSVSWYASSAGTTTAR